MISFRPEDIKAVEEVTEGFQYPTDKSLSNLNSVVSLLPAGGWARKFLKVLCKVNDSTIHFNLHLL